MTPAYLELAWDQPECDDNNEATLYYIEMKEERQPDFTPIARVDGKLTKYTCEFMQRNKKYDFQVRGKNSAGYGEPARLKQLVELSKAIGKILVYRNCMRIYSSLKIGKTTILNLNFRCSNHAIELEASRCG